MRGTLKKPLIPAWLGLIAWGLAASAAAGESHLLIVSGLGGEPKYSEAFYRWSSAMFDAAEKRFGLPSSNIIFLAEDPAKDTTRIKARATKENVQKELEELARKAGPGDQVFILLFGHGSFQGGESRFNLPGPDLTAADFARLLDRFRSQRVVFVNTASSSGDFVGALRGKNRTVITATKTGFERNETVFGEYFVEAFAGDGADVDKDGRVSMLEAFNYARRRVARFYEEEGRLQTEHALLEDNGDGRGSSEPDGKALDGAMARAIFLSGASAAAGGEPGRLATRTDEPPSPELAGLYEQKRALEERIEALKAQKEAMSPELYQQELEKLLVELAVKGKAIRELEGKQP